MSPGRIGWRLASFLADELTRRGFPVAGVSAADWGWCISLENARFPLWVGCGNYDGEDAHFICFIQPLKRRIWRRFRRIDTSVEVGPLVSALNAILAEDARIRDIRWLNDKGL